MNFREKILDCVSVLNEMKSVVTNEESTKQTLILPFLSAMGYNIHDPREVAPEYAADTDRYKRGKRESVDYGIFIDSNLSFLIEAKPLHDELVDHDAQLFRYFAASPEVKIAIITNGMTYKFFTDSKHKNVIDPLPFYILDVDYLDEHDIEFLHLLTKERFNPQRLFRKAKIIRTTKDMPGTIEFAKYSRPKKMDCKNLTITIDVPLYDFFQKYAKKYNVNRSELIRDLISNYFEEHGFDIKDPNF